MLYPRFLFASVLLLAACGTTDTSDGLDESPLMLTVRGPEGFERFPQPVAPSVETIRLFAVEGDVVHSVREDPVGAWSGALPPSTTDPTWIAVEGLDATGTVVASGATAVFDRTQAAAPGPLAALTLRPNTVAPAFEPASTGSQPLLLPEHVAGHTMTNLGANRGWLIAGGVEFGLPSDEGPSILAASDALIHYDPYRGTLLPVCDADLLDAGTCDADTCATVASCHLRLSEARGFHAAAATRTGDVTVIGGLTREGVATSTVDLISIGATGRSGTRRTLNDSTEALLDARAFCTATPMSDGSIVVVGGMGGSLSSPTFPARVERCEDACHLFRPVMENDLEIAITPRAMHTATRVGRRILIVGGRTAREVVRTSELLVLDGDDILNDPPPTEPMLIPRFGHAASLIELPLDGAAFDGEEVMITGGFTEVGDGNLLNGLAPTASAEFYLGDAYAFYSGFAAQMHTARAFHSQTALPIIDEAFVYGGIDGSWQTIEGLATGERLTLYPGQPAIFDQVASSAEGGSAFAPAALISPSSVVQLGGWDGGMTVNDGVLYNSGDTAFLHVQF